jgi:hypothetical protein
MMAYQSVSPLIDFCNADSRKQYDNGVWWRLHGWRTRGRAEAPGLLPDSYFVNDLKGCVARHEFDTPTGEQRARLSLCFSLGLLHGGVLSPETGLLRPQVSTLAILTNDELARGYEVGRRWYFVDAMPDENRVYTDEQVMEELRLLVQEHQAAFVEKDDTIVQYIVGNLLGAMSARLFPATVEEQQRWEAERHYWMQVIEQQERKTELVSLNMLQHA